MCPPRQGSALPRPPAIRLSPPPGVPTGSLPPAVRQAVTSPGSGDPLASEIAAPLGRGLGVDPGPVRVHTGPLSAAAAAELGVRAFTWGVHIHLAKGERPTDLPLLAHEVTHAVQQSGGPAIHLFDGPHGELEREAHRSAAAVARGGRAVVRGRTGGAGVQGLFDWARRGIAAVGGAISSAVSAVADVGAALRDRVMAFIKDKAKSIPGYDLLGFILGRDPITQQPVERTAEQPDQRGARPGTRRGCPVRQPSAGQGHPAGIRLVHHGDHQPQHHLALHPGPVLTGLGCALDHRSGQPERSLGEAEEHIRPAAGAHRRLRASPPGRKVLEFIFEGALALAGSAGQQILAIFRRIGAVFNLIVVRARCSSSATCSTR